MALKDTREGRDLARLLDPDRWQEDVDRLRAAMARVDKAEDDAARHHQGGLAVIPKPPTPQVISALLRKAGYDRSEVISRATMNHRYTTGFYVRSGRVAGKTEVYVNWRLKKPAPAIAAEQAERERNQARALELAGEYAEAIRAAGWPAEVIHLAGPLVRVTAKTEEN